MLLPDLTMANLRSTRPCECPYHTGGPLNPLFVFWSIIQTFFSLDHGPQIHRRALFTLDSSYRLYQTLFCNDRCSMYTANEMRLPQLLGTCLYSHGSSATPLSIITYQTNCCRDVLAQNMPKLILYRPRRPLPEFVIPCIFIGIHCGQC
jgi:hypothetical protein